MKLTKLRADILITILRIQGKDSHAWHEGTAFGKDITIACASCQESDPVGDTLRVLIGIKAIE